MKKTLSSLMMNQLTIISRQLDIYETALNEKNLTQDEIEFYKFMCCIYSEVVKKIQQKIFKEKLTNKKLKFISE
jgi:hypothetical protein